MRFQAFWVIGAEQNPNAKSKHTLKNTLGSGKRLTSLQCINKIRQPLTHDLTRGYLTFVSFTLRLRP